MARLLQYVSSDPAFLLQRAAAGFLVQPPATEADPFPTPSSWLVVRHHGLRDDLYRLAWERGVRGWFDPPLCTFREVPAAFGQVGPRGLTEPDRMRLLGRLVRAHPQGLFHGNDDAGSWINALDSLFGQLASADVAPASLRTALNAAPNRDQFERTRDTELADLYQAYLAELTEAGRRDGRDDLQDTVRFITRDPETFVLRLGGRRVLRILGLMDLHGGWKGLLRALVETPALDRVELYTLQGLALPADLPASLVRLDSPLPPVLTTLFTAPDPAREADEVARRVRERIDAGASPLQIAIVARAADPALDHVTRALVRAGVPAQPRSGRRAAPAEQHDGSTWSGESSSGVVVAEASAVAYRSFDFVFVMGLANGAFPARRAPSPLLSAETGRVLAEQGLPFPSLEEWLEHESRLFDALLGAPRLGRVLSFPRCDDLGNDLGPSAFFERVRRTVGREPETIRSSPFFLLPFGTAAAQEQGAYAAEVERTRSVDSHSPWSGQIEDRALLAVLAERWGPSRAWPPAELERYAMCPFAYFSSHLLQLEQRDELEERMDRLRREALRRVYAKLSELAGGPVYLLPAELARAEALVEAGVDQERLKRELHSLFRAETQEHAASFTNRGSARKMVRTGVVAHDVTLDDVMLQGTSGGSLRVRGTLDRLELSVDDRLRVKKLATAVEYAASAAATPGQGDKSAWDDRVVLELPLYALALAQVRPDLKLARAEYRELETGSAVHRVQPMQVESTSKTPRRVPTEQARLDVALDAAIEYAASIQAGAFPPAPAPSCNCPSSCHARDFCRIPGGARKPPC